MKISSVKVNYKKKPFFSNKKISIIVEHKDGRFLGFIVKHGSSEREFKVKFKPVVDILGPWKQMEKYVGSILKK